MVAGFVVLLLSSFVSLLTGLFVFARNPKLKLNRIYSLITIDLILFSVFNYLSLGTDHKLTYIRLVMVTTTLSVYGGYLLIYQLNNQTIRLSVKNRLLFLGTIAVAFLDLSPLVFDGLTKTTTPIPKPNFGFLFYLIQFVSLVIISGMMLFNGLRRSQGVLIKQNQTLLIGYVPLLILAPITGFILPVALGNSKFIFLSPVYSAFFVCTVGYTIIKHKLFDIKLIVVRAITYVTSLSFVAALYGFISLVLIKLFFHPTISIAAEVFLAMATAVAGLSFHRIKTAFDHITNRVFYQDAYDAQVFLDEFNKIIVSTFDLNKLLNKILSLVEENLKPAYCLFGLKEDDYMPRKIIGTGNMPEFSEADINYVRNQTPRMHKKIIVTDLLEEKHNGLANVLKKLNVSIIARMTTSIDAEGIGYLVLGPKKNGSMYTSQDIKVLEIIANELVVAVQNALHTEEIERFNITLQAKIKEATHRLRQSNDKLRALDEAKDDFVSMASHQLRTPLTSVKGNISLVLDGDAGKISDLQRQLLQQAFASSQRMVFLIADLLNVSRLKTGKFLIERAPVDLAAVIEEEVNQLQDTAKSRNLSLNYNKPDHVATLMLDDTKTRQVIMNFIDNAIYYTPSGGRIDVELKETPAGVECRVKDNGIGVPKDEQHHLFTKFYRAGNARKARPDGTGLGLFMAKKVIVSEGGAIIFETQEGKGSTFGFSFPKANLMVGSQTKLKAPSNKPAEVRT